MSDKTKTYIITSGKHIDAKGKKYVKGDRIELTEEQAKGLVNKIVDPEQSFGVSVSANNSEEITGLRAENERLKERIAELETEVEELKEAMPGDED